MAALLDTEKFGMPHHDHGVPMFSAEFGVSFRSNGSETLESFVQVTVPEYMEGQTDKHEAFIYNSCGFLYVDVDSMLDDFINDYGITYDSMDEARFLRNSFQNLISKLDAFIAENEGE
jgi:hypothetical protein